MSIIKKNPVSVEKYSYKVTHFTSRGIGYCENNRKSRAG